MGGLQYVDAVHEARYLCRPRLISLSGAMAQLQRPQGIDVGSRVFARQLLVEQNRLVADR